MPTAAWCDECGRYVWVTPTGQCENGHASTSLRCHYETERVSVPPVDQRAPVGFKRRLLIVGVAIVLPLLVLLITGLAAASYVAKATEPARRLAVETDAFIAREYPDFTVVQREPFTNYHGIAGPGSNYFLRRDGNPEFVLLVAVCKPPVVTKEIRDLELAPHGPYLTTDEVFSQTMMERSWVSTAVASAVISEYLLAKPSSHAVIARTAQADRLVCLGIAADIRYSPGLGYMSPLYPTKLGEAEVQGPLDDARPLVSYRISDIPED